MSEFISKLILTSEFWDVLFIDSLIQADFFAKIWLNFECPSMISSQPNRDLHTIPLQPKISCIIKTQEQTCLKLWAWNLLWHKAALMTNDLFAPNLGGSRSIFAIYLSCWCSGNMIKFRNFIVKIIGLFHPINILKGPSKIGLIFTK